MRVATYNVCHGSAGRGTPVDLDAMIAACAALDADVVALPEVDQGRRRSQGADQAGRTAAAMGATHAFGPTLWAATGTDVDDGHYGNALLTIGTLDHVEQMSLPRVGHRWRRPSERRGAVLATVVVGGQAVSVAATHLSTSRLEAIVQLWTLSRALRRRPGPHVLLGDCNLATPTVAAVLRPTGLRLVTPGGPTYPRQAPRRRIDHVAVAGLLVAGVEVIDTGTSDHRALVVDLSA